MSATMVASDASGWRFLRREVTVVESRLLAVSGAVGAAMLTAVLQQRWTSVLGFVLIGATALVPVFVIRFALKPHPGLGSLFVFWLVVFSATVADARVLFIGFGALAVALILTRLEQSRALRRAALLGTFRDALWRSIGIIAIAIAAVAVADRIERVAFDASFGTPLEGLAFSGGILAGLLVLIALASAIWSLPRIAVKRMSAGVTLPAAAAEALWFGTLTFAIAIAFDLRAIAAKGAFSEALGRNCWLAIAAVFAFAVVRLGAPSAIDAAIQPLWILFLGDTAADASLRRHAAVLAARWRNGPVTIVAPPEVAPAWRGVHVRLAQLRGQLEALFPRRPIHFADWLDTLPPQPRWQTLPIRELYADDTLWPRLFESHLEADSAIVVIDGKEPGDAMIDRLRALLPTSRTDFHLPVIESPRLAARWPGLEIYPIAGAVDRLIDDWIVKNGTPRETAVTPRFALIAHAERDTATAKALELELTGKVDSRGMTVRAGTILIGGGGGPLANAWRRLKIDNWQKGVAIRKIRLTGPGRWFEPLALLAKTLPADIEFDLLVLESNPAEVISFGVKTMLGDVAVTYPNRVIPVLWAGVHHPPPFSFVTGSGVILYRPDAPDVAVADVARRYLDLAFDRDGPLVDEEQTAASPELPKRRPRVFLSYSRDYRELAFALRSRLEETSEIADIELLAGGSFERQVEKFLTEADVVLALIGPETPSRTWALKELEIAASLGKPVLPILIGRANLPAFISAVPANTDAYGDLLDLTEDLAGAERAWEITIANINSALAKLPI